jgi:hypothetical protein
MERLKAETMPINIARFWLITLSFLGRSNLTPWPDKLMLKEHGPVLSVFIVIAVNSSKERKVILNSVNIPPERQ